MKNINISLVPIKSHVMPLSSAEAAPPYIPLSEKDSSAELCERAEYSARGGRHKEAIHLLNMATGKNPKNQTAYKLKGLSLLSLHRFGAALSMFRKCLALAPQRKYYHFYLGAVYLTMKKYHLAVQEYRKALNSTWPFDDKKFTNAVIYHQIGSAYAAWRRPGEAFWCYEQVFSLGDYFGAPLHKRADAINKKNIKPKKPEWATHS